MSYWTILTTLSSSTLVGAIVGAVLFARWTLRREREQRRSAFIEKQLTHFYGPMFALRVEIRALSETRKAYEDAAQEGWSDAMHAVDGAGPEVLRQTSEEQRPKYERLIEYGNTEFHEVLLPKYRAMASLFRDHLWLADLDTRDYYPKLVGWISSWDRHKADAIPPGAMARMTVSEEELKPLYENVQRRHDELREELRRPT